MNEHVATRERLDSINLLCSLDLNSKYLEMPSLAAGDGKHNTPSYTAVCMSMSIINYCRISTAFVRLAAIFTNLVQTCQEKTMIVEVKESNRNLI